MTVSYRFYNARIARATRNAAAHCTRLHASRGTARGSSEWLASLDDFRDWLIGEAA
jgi:hypothetical protein